MTLKKSSTGSTTGAIAPKRQPAEPMTSPEVTAPQSDLAAIHEQGKRAGAAQVAAQVAALKGGMAAGTNESLAAAAAEVNQFLQEVESHTAGFFLAIGDQIASSYEGQYDGSQN